MLQAKTQGWWRSQMGMDTDALAYFVEYCEMSYSNQSTIATLKRMGYFDVVGDHVSHFYLGSD